MFEKNQIVTIKVGGQLVSAVFIEYSKKWETNIVNYLGKRKYATVYTEDGVALKHFGPHGYNKVAREIHPVKQSPFDVNKRFGFVDNLVDMVIKGDSKSVFVSGSSGIGKTHEVLARLSTANLIDIDSITEDDDDDPEVMEVVENAYKLCKGYSTAKALYRTLYNNRERVIIFDDCDSIFESVTAVNILKSAIDSYDTRRVSYLTEKVDDSLPKSFNFEGRIIFISNLSLTQIDSAILTRVLYADLTLTAEEKITRIRSLLPVLRPELPIKEKEDCLELIEEYRDSICDLNIRTAIKLFEIRHTQMENWRELGAYLITAL